MNDQKYPNDPKNISIRPLTKGMMRHLAANQLPMESGWTVQDMIVFRGGLETRPRYVKEFDSLFDPKEDTIRTLFLHWEDTNTFRTIALGDRFIYHLTLGNVSRLNWDIYNSTADVEENGSLWGVEDSAATFTTSGYKIGDYCYVDGHLCKIESVWSETELTVKDTTGLVVAGLGLSLSVVKSFNGGSIYPIQYARSAGNSGKTYLSGASNRSLVKYTVANGYEELDLFPESTTFITDIRCIEIVGNRIFVGNFSEDGQVRTNRIRWGQSYPLDMENFDSGDSSFYDFLEARTGLVRLKKMGALMVAYFGDQIYFGRPTNIAKLPYSFTKMDTGNIGLAGPRAICEWTDGHFFVGQDDIYFFSPAGPPQPIGSPVVKQTIQKYKNYLHAAQVMPDPQRDRILFLFPSLGEQSEEIWSFNYKDKSWSYETLSVQGLGFTSTTEFQRIDSVSPAYVNPDTYDPTAQVNPAPINEQIDNIPGQIDDYKASYSKRKIFLIHENDIFKTYDSPTESCNLGPIIPVYESPDIDFSTPDQVKTINRLSVKLENIWEPTLTYIDPVTFDVVSLEDENLLIKVEWSGDRGKNWKQAGILKIRPGDDEGKVNMVATGGQFRYRLTFISKAKQVKIVEVGLRAKVRSTEVTY